VKTLEASLLHAVDIELTMLARRLGLDNGTWSGRLALLELMAGQYAGWDVAEYWDRFGAPNTVPSDLPSAWIEDLMGQIAQTGIPIPLALSALSRELLASADQRTSGAYHTDWRLAQLLARQSVPKISTDGIWVDAACGSGILLAAAAMEVPSGTLRDEVIRDQLTGADLSEVALRGARLSVASLTTSLDAVAGFDGRLLLQDSLKSRESWRKVAGHGAALVIGNPPWERLRASRHESEQRAGKSRRYGESFDVDIDLSASRSELLNYIRSVTGDTNLQGRGEHDLYKLFLELGLALAAEDGILAMLLPAGLVRSQGTEMLRRELTEVSSELSISIIENRARHFAIDTRFKFLAITARIGSGERHAIELRVADRTGGLPKRAVEIPRERLALLRPDLSVPEVKTDAEWHLYADLARRAVTVGDPAGPWHPQYRREVDMTLDRHLFQKSQSGDALPLLEGRHVSQFRWRSKRYVSGEGRAAIWEPQGLRGGALEVQWFVSPSDLSPGTAERISRSRIGFCDITGQTNERSLLVARVPAGVVCGNKVPTIHFSNADPAIDDLFLTLTNSFVVDWMLRRVVTTTVNFFILDALPLPAVATSSDIGVSLVELGRAVTAAEGDAEVDRGFVGGLRSRIDALTAFAWGITPDQMRLVLDDFPLLDRGQPTIDGESASTITRDCVLSELGKLYDETSMIEHDRVERALEAGALPFIPAEYAWEGQEWRSAHR
jgi:hypothetical protein